MCPYMSLSDQRVLTWRCTGKSASVSARGSREPVVGGVVGIRPSCPTLWTRPGSVGPRTYSAGVAWSVGRATWVGDVTDPDIAQQVGSRTFERGQAYAAQRRVRSFATRPDGMMLLGTIEGSGGETYQTIIEARPHPKGRSHLWSGRCSCPVAADCKHVVALMLVARDIAHGRVLEPMSGAGGEGAGGEGMAHPAPPVPAPNASAPHWSDVLGHLRPRSDPPRSAPERPGPRG